MVFRQSAMDAGGPEVMSADSVGHEQPSAAGVDRATLLAMVFDLADTFTRLVDSAPDPSVPVPASPGWSVRDVAAHLATVVPRYAQGPEGGGRWVDDPADLPALNDELVAELAAVPVDELASTIRAATAALLEQIAGYGDDVPSYRFNGGQIVAADTALGILAGELAVHGYDMANAVDARWPIHVGHVDAILHGLEDVLPGWLDPSRSRSHTAGYEIRLRGGSRHVWSFREGRLDCRADPTRTRIDCHMSGDPAALLLVMYGRRSPWRAALSGQVVAWGRRPWLALSLPRRFHNP